MRKFSDIEEIKRAYNYKIGAANKRLTIQLRKFNDGENVKVRKTTVKKSDDPIREKCMRLLQVNCRMERALELNSKSIPCCSCDHIYFRWDLSGGHRYSRAIRRTCIDPMNVNPQCSYCNGSFGRQEKRRIEDNYDLYLIKTYGISRFRALKVAGESKTPFQVDTTYREQEQKNLKEQNEILKEQIKESGLQK